MALLTYSVLPLKDIANRKTVAVLFKQPDILSSVRNFHRKSILWNDESLKVWRETVEDKMSDKISKIRLPATLTKLLIDTAKTMGRQIPGWKTLHEEYLFNFHEKGMHFDVPILERLCWTSTGALDYQKTAEELIRFDVLDIVKQYQLACLYCLEDDIRLFWKKLPEEKKMYFYDENLHFTVGKLRLQFWWPYIIRGEHCKLNSMTRSCTRDRTTFHQYVFQHSVGERNKAAAEYFFRKLTQEEKEASLMNATRMLVHCRNCNHGDFPKVKVSETLRYLLSVMTHDQQMQIFLWNPSDVLECFLHWPLQDQFSDAADLIWNFVPETDYDSVLREMYESFANSGHYFQTLFREFFLRIPYDFRKSFVDRQCRSSSCFATALRLQDKEALAAIFRSADAATRAGLVFSKFFLKHFDSSTSKETMDIVATCLREARLSKEDRERLKETFMGFLASTEGGELELETRKLARFFHFLDETDGSRKRRSEDETLTEAKMKKEHF